MSTDPLYAYAESPKGNYLKYAFKDGQWLNLNAFFRVVEEPIQVNLRVLLEHIQKGKPESLQRFFGDLQHSWVSKDVLTVVLQFSNGAAMNFNREKLKTFLEHVQSLSS